MYYIIVSWFPKQLRLFLVTLFTYLGTVYQVAYILTNVKSMPYGTELLIGQYSLQHASVIANISLYCCLEYVHCTALISTLEILNFLEPQPNESVVPVKNLLHWKSHFYNIQWTRRVL